MLILLTTTTKLRSKVQGQWQRKHDSSVLFEAVVNQSLYLKTYVLVVFTI
jgi:hypothetical protein